MAATPFSAGQPVTLRDATGAHTGTADSPMVVSGAPAGDATIIDGGDVTQGEIADAAATAGSTGTISAKLRTATGQLAALGAIADAAEDDPSQSASIVALLKGILTTMNAVLVADAAILAILTDVHDAGGHTLKTSTV